MRKKGEREENCGKHLGESTWPLKCQAWGGCSALCVECFGTTVHCTCRVKSIQVQLTFSLLQVLGSQHITEGLTRKKKSTTTRSQRQI